MPQYIIMDLDGTLINTEGRDYQSFLCTAREFGFKDPDPQTILQKRKAGLLSDRILSELSGIDSPEKLRPLMEFRTRYIQSQEILCHDRCFDGITSSLEQLQRAGTKNFIATLRTKKQQVWELLRREKIDLFFEDIFCVEDLGAAAASRAGSLDTMVEHKFQILQKLMAHIDLEPGKTPFVGDTIFDMQAGRRLGFLGVGVSTGFTPKLQLQEYADRCFETMEEFTGWMLRRQS